MIRLKPTLRFLIIKSTNLFSIPSFKSTLTIHSKIQYDFGLFNKSWRDKEFAITQQIKKTTSSEQLMAIIRRKGHMMNLVHLTAILDRMEQSQMINTYDIVSFTVQKIKDFEQVFKFTQPNWIRTICNIVCYLGNIKNTNLNYLFRMVNYSQVLTKSKSIQKTMVITGLIRLNLFNEVFSLAEDSVSTKKLSFEDVISNGFKLNQILSIWFAIVNSTQVYANSSMHSVFQTIINQSERQMALSYRQYTYAIICYTHTYSQLKNPRSGKLYELVYYEIPRKVSKKDYLPPHQLSLLLYAINRLRKYENNSKKDENLQKIKYYKFQDVLISNFHEIMVKKYATLRHIANNFKILNQLFKLDEQIVYEVLQKMLTLLKQELQLIANTPQNYKMNKIDSLSICSLIWKINEYFYRKRNELQEFQIIKQYNIRVASFLVQIQKQGIFGRFTVQELLMLYSGFFSATHVTQIDLPQQFKQISYRVLMNTVRKLTLKQYTLFYTYFKKIQFVTPQFCRFIKQHVDQLCQLSHTNNPTAMKIAQQNLCIMEKNQNCLGCLLKPNNPETLK